MKESLLQVHAGVGQPLRFVLVGGCGYMVNLLGFSALFAFPEWIQDRGHKDVGIELWIWWRRVGGRGWWRRRWRGWWRRRWGELVADERRDISERGHARRA